jgi:hypothetical protein
MAHQHYAAVSVNRCYSTRMFIENTTLNLNTHVNRHANEYARVQCYYDNIVSVLHNVVLKHGGDKIHMLKGV